MRELQFPALTFPHDAALRACVNQAFKDYDVVAIVASGTIIRGTPDPRSDLDIHILHSGTFRERIQAFHAGVPCEIFVNPPSRIQGYFDEDAADRRPLTAHMFESGFIVFDPTGIAAELVETAKQSLLAIPPAPSGMPPPGVYGAATLFESVDDLALREPEAAALILGQAVQELALCRVAAEPGWLPRAKDLLSRLKEIDPEAASLAADASSSALFADRLEAARKLCVLVAGADGFFEWRSPREDIHTLNTC